MLEPLLHKTTENQFDAEISRCRQRFSKKTQDYGCPWRFMKLPMITNFIFEKTWTLRSDDHQPSQFIEIINDTLVGLIQFRSLGAPPTDIDSREALILYDREVVQLRALMLKKNHDYGEAWRDMRISTFTDLILMKLLRIRQIENHDGKTVISEGIDAGYQDIVNYSVFALIRMSEQ